ncbi:Tat pathway signal sequence [Mycena sanguinolenta]|uniref:Tat pathway signal sequence n=1 Tax=Mycena sanguinolenta TaxID=230812 RepID=A0A8H6XB83_9AGAR|nr:Tat pathway signal sequence [Mycena sanguinolenta]
MSCTDFLKLEQFLSSTSNPDTGALWPLVQKVEVRGRFPVLSTGIVLVDLPGHGDTDETRNNSAAEYIKRADGVVLVVDIKRAQDDRDTLAFLRSMLNQFLIDGRSVEDSVVLVATGTDNPFDENEITLGQSDQEKVDSLNKDLKDLRKSIRLHKSKSKIQPRSKRQRDVEEQIREKEQEKCLVLALSRNTKARSSIQHVFHQINSGLAPPENSTPQLPVFCVGSHDFLALLTRYRSPLTFFRKDAVNVFGYGQHGKLNFSDVVQTEIVSLKNHIRDAGESRRTKWSTDLLGRADAFSESVHLYFSEGRCPGQRLVEDKQKALEVLTNLEKRNLKNLNALLTGIKKVLLGIDQSLAKAVEKAKDAAPLGLRKFDNTHWNTYKALMARNGVYFEYDLNHKLIQTIVPEIQSNWSRGLNHRIPLDIKEAIRIIKESTFEAIDNIVEIFTGRGTLFEQTISRTLRSLAIENVFSDILENSLESISDAQRDATRSFKIIVQQQMVQQYQAAAQESGPGSFDRMKLSNLEFVKQNGPHVFNPISSHTEALLHAAVKTIENNIKTELRDLRSLLRLCLIDDINLQEDHLDLKKSILKVTVENRPRFAAKKVDLEDRRATLKMGVSNSTEE